MFFRKFTFHRTKNNSRILMKSNNTQHITRCLFEENFITAAVQLATSTALTLTVSESDQTAWRDSTHTHNILRFQRKQPHGIQPTFLKLNSWLPGTGFISITTTYILI